MVQKILIVEDENLIALDMQDMLERDGYAVTEIASAARVKPDFVLMDIRLRAPRDGIETAARIHAEMDIPIFVTSHADAGTLARSRATGACGWIVKPFMRQDFRARIETALEAGAWPSA